MYDKYKPVELSGAPNEDSLKTRGPVARACRPTRWSWAFGMERMREPIRSTH